MRVLHISAEALDTPTDLTEGKCHSACRRSKDRHTLGPHLTAVCRNEATTYFAHASNIRRCRCRAGGGTRSPAPSCGDVCAAFVGHPFDLGLPRDPVLLDALAERECLECLDGFDGVDTPYAQRSVAGHPCPSPKDCRASNSHSNVSWAITCQGVVPVQPTVQWKSCVYIVP